MYQTWKEIKDLRKENGYQKSNVNLKIYKKIQENGDIDYYFDNTQDTPDERLKLDKETPLDRREINRRENIRALEVQCGLRINGK